MLLIIEFPCPEMFRSVAIAKVGTLYLGSMEPVNWAEGFLVPPSSPTFFCRPQKQKGGFMLMCYMSSASSLKQASDLRLNSAME